jgi:hypothetical protein
MLKNTANFMLFVLLGAVLFVTSCKKDPFSEKDALQAQKELLAQKFGYDLAIANVSLQIQRAGDSARIAIQNLVNKGASDLEKERLAAALSLKLADYNYLLTELRYRDSLSRIQDYVNRVGGVKSYQIRVTDFTTKAPINGATVKVLPWGSANFVSVKTNSDGLASFSNIIVDPNAIFYATDENTGVTSATTMKYRSSIDASPVMEVYRGTGATATTTVSGALRARLDLTNSSTSQNLGAGRSVTLSTVISGNRNGIDGLDVTWSFAGITGTSGTYSIAVPRGYTYSISVPSVTAMQKMFVNYIDGVDNQYTSVTRLDSALVSFSAASSALTTSPAVTGFFLKLPADSLTGVNVNVRDNSSRSFIAAILANVTRDIRSADGKSIDTLATRMSYNVSNMIINNGWFSNALSHNYKVRLDADGVRVPDTLAVEVVNLTQNGFIESMPEFVAITDVNGKLASIQTKRVSATNNVNVNGGRFYLNPYVVAYSWTTADFLPHFNNYSNYTPTTLTGIVVGATSVTKNVTYGTSSLYGYSAK